MHTLTIRKHISLKEEEYELIVKNARLQGISFSEFLKNAALLFIKQKEDLHLAEFLNHYCNSISLEEQAEIEQLKIDYDDLQGEELEINDFL